MEPAATATFVTLCVLIVILLLLMLHKIIRNKESLEAEILTNRTTIETAPNMQTLISALTTALQESKRAALPSSPRMGALSLLETAGRLMRQNV